MTTTHRELELKFRTPADFTMPDFARVTDVDRVESRPTFTMTNVYYDTPDLRLFRWGITLRRREGGPDAGWHLKLPVAGRGHGVRDEVREPLGPEVPPTLARLVTAYARTAPLGPVAALRTERTPRVLRDARGREVIEVVDDHVSIMDGSRITATFREVEAESLVDPPDEGLLAHVGQALLDAGATPGTMSKAGAALGPRSVAPPEIPSLEWPSASSPAGDVVAAYLTAHARRLLAADLRLRRGLPDAVHQMRVSARRLRSGLRVFAPLLEAAWAQPLRAELGWMASGLGAARDTEVLWERLGADASRLGEPDGPFALAIVDEAMRTRAAEAQVLAHDVVDSPRYTALLEDLVDGVRRPPLTPRAAEAASTALPPLVAKAFRRLQRRVARLDLATPSAEWHVARIAAKRARYAAEAVAPVLGDRMRDLAERLEEVTEILGRHQDAHVAQAALRTLLDAPHSDDAPDDLDVHGAFALGRLLAVEQAAEMDDRAAFMSLWPDVRKAARRADVR